MIRALIFDLDDTLYAESEFVASGYRAVAEHVAARSAAETEDVFQAMMRTFATDGRSLVLPGVIRRYPHSSASIDELVEIYRGHAPKIRLRPAHRSLLRRLRRRYRLGIITDGHPQVQRNKVRALGLQELVDAVVYTWDYGQERQKPDPRPFALLLEQLGVAPAEALMVGDNAAKDCRGAHAAGICAALVQPSGSGRGPDAPEFVISSLDELTQILKEAR